MKLSSLFFAITILFLIKLSITTGSSSSDEFDDDDDDEFDDPRIRREIRELSSSEWRRIANAINIMKATSNEDGIEIYGDKFETYDSIVCRHALAVAGIKTNFIYDTFWIIRFAELIVFGCTFWLHFFIHSHWRRSSSFHTSIFYSSSYIDIII